jgi:protein phosphatase 2C family protein 2/3
MLTLASIPVLKPSKTAVKPYGSVISYAANTHEGISRTYNEDRVSIVLEMKKST